MAKELISLRIDKDVLDKLDDQCKKEIRNRSAMLEIILAKEFEIDLANLKIKRRREKESKED